MTSTQATLGNWSADAEHYRVITDNNHGDTTVAFVGKSPNFPADAALIAHAKEMFDILSLVPLINDGCELIKYLRYRTDILFADIDDAYASLKEHEDEKLINEMY